MVTDSADTAAYGIDAVGMVAIALLWAVPIAAVMAVCATWCAIQRAMGRRCDR